MTRAGAYLLLFAYVIVVGAAYYSTQHPESVGLGLGTCGESPCVTWVMPGGLAWESGVRPGMRVGAINGQPVESTPPGQASPSTIEHISLQVPSGGEIVVVPRQHPVVEGPLKFTLWGLGALFVLLGWAVALRRPDHHPARMFALFAGAGGLALAVSPSSDGPKQTWALVAQVATLLPVGALCLAFVASLIGYSQRLYRQYILPAKLVVGFLIAVGYLASVLVSPTLYEGVGPALDLYVSFCLFGSVLILWMVGQRQPSPIQRQQARLALAGIAVGTFPLVVLVLIPEALGFGPLIPVYLAALATGLVPLFFAYAILQFQLLGIRKLVHRGMVYSIASVSLLAVTSTTLALALTVLTGAKVSETPVLLFSALVVAGVLLFQPLRAGARRLVDKVMYGEVVDYRHLIEVVRRDLLAPSQTQEIAAAMARMFLNSLRLESVLVFLGDSPTTARLVVAEGERCAEVLASCYPKLRPEDDRDMGHDLIEVNWHSEALLLAPLALPGSHLGHILLGPKRRGEVFLEEERQLVNTILPVLALAIEKSEQSRELRELNQQLVNAAEAERGRIAQDIHDGPLQKALLLAGVGGSNLQDPMDMARQLAADLRDICSRLRPAILDDLGIVSALEWLLDDVASRSEISTKLVLDNVGEDDRLPPDIELALFRVTQEAANNAIKHSGGDMLTVSLSRMDGTIALTVTDNGRGLPADLKRARGLGISGMSERVAQLGGIFDIQSVPGAGTTVIGRFPLEGQWAREFRNGAASQRDTR